MWVLTFFEGARKHLEAAEMKAQEIQSLLSTHVMQNSEGKACGAVPATSPGKRLFSMWCGLLCFSLIVPYPLTIRSTAIACLKPCSLPLVPSPISKPQEKGHHRSNELQVGAILAGWG